MNKVLIVLESGFEEIEATIPVDVLRRLNFEVTIAGATSPVEGSHGIKVIPDILFSQIDSSGYDCLILPGGMPGSINLRDNPIIIHLVSKMFSEGKIIAAICAAPVVLAKAGILKGKKATCYPSFKNELGGGCLFTATAVETAGSIITARGPGASFEFAAKIAETLGKKAELVKLYSDMFIQ